MALGPVTDDQIRRLMHRSVREHHGFSDVYWVAFLALYGVSSSWAGRESRTHTMTREEARKECEAIIKLIGDSE